MDKLMCEVRDEIEASRVFFQPFHSPHEAYGVICEEVQEFFDQVRKWKPSRYRDGWFPETARKELIQIAAMSIRTIEDLELKGE